DSHSAYADEEWAALRALVERQGGDRAFTAAGSGGGYGACGSHQEAINGLADHAGDDEQELMLGQRGTGVTTVEAPVESDDRWGRGGLLRRDDTQQDGGRQQSSQ
ncbi:unnamed protein product, partial [Sphacelaria rigidula]